MSIEGKRVALTGKLRRITRSDATSQLEDLGAEVTAVVTDGTDLVIAGADSIAPHLPNVPVLDEEALEKLLAGTPLAALLGTPQPDATARPPLPPITWQRDGVYQRADASGRVLVDGPVVGARMHGVWHYRWPNGAPSREVEHACGLEHGREREWNERGVLTYRGQNVDGRSTGPCEWLHEDGERVSTCTEYRDGEQHGEHRELHPDGSPRVIGRNVRGRAEGLWAWLAPDGTQSTRRYRGGFLVAVPAPIEADKKLLDKTLRAVKKAGDRWEQEAALEAIPSDGNRFVLVHLWRAGLLDLAEQPGLWELLAEAAIDPACAITGAELVAWLVTISPKAKLAGAHLDGWPLPLDRAACHVFARDPEAFDPRAWPGAAPAIRRGLESVLRRAGAGGAARLEDLAEPMARALVHAAPLPRISWFEDGAVVERDLVRDHEPTPAFHELVATYSTAEAWGRASLARAVARGVRYLDLTRLHDAARFASVDQLGSMIERVAGPHVPHATIAPFLLASPLPPDALAQVALGEVDLLRRNAAVWAAIIRHGDAGLAVPDTLVEALSWLGSSTPTAQPVAAAIAALPSHRKDEPALAAARVRFSRDAHPMLEGLAWPLRAARLLGPRLADVIRRDLAAGRALAVAPLLHVVDDPVFWQAAIATMRALPHPSSTEHVGVALGMLPVTALPILAAAHDDEAREHVRDWLAVAIVAVLAHAASDAVAWDASYDRFLRTDLGETVEERRFIDPLVCAAIAGLAEPRAAATLVANLDATDRERFTRAFALLGLCATPAVMAHALHTLLDLEPTLLGSDLARIEAGLGGLFEPNEWVRWLLAAGAGSRLGSALVAVVGNEEKLDALRAEVVASGARVARALDSIDVIEAMAARFAEAAKQTVYLLRRVDDLPSDAGYNRIGGVPVGITSRKWPKRRGKPMTHVFTLDAVTMPALAKVLGKDARTVSLFLATPEPDEATEPGNDWAKVVVVGAKDVAKGELAPPAAAALRDQKWFEPVPVDVPAAVFGARAGALRELREEIAKHPRVLGEPSWLQEPAHQGTLLVELDEHFAELSSGDGGRLYVFADTAFWQRR